MRKVSLPILRRIEVDGYLMYPGMTRSPGLTHTFVEGVNVVIGINGIGKTTFLTLLLRLMTGPRDLRDLGEIGGSQRSLVSIETGIFAGRVPDRAREATATLCIQINDSTIELKRSLSNLQLIELSINGAVQVGEHSSDLEEKFKIAVLTSSHLDDFYDFVLLLRYLVFYLEDRRSLIWDKWAQTEILRILFVPETLQSTYKLAINQALSADSTARNTQTILTRQTKALENAIRSASQSSPSDLNLLRVKVQELTGKSERLGEELVQLDEERRDRRKDAVQARHAAERVSQEERAARESYLAQIFPRLTDYGSFVIASIQAGRGCLVCGTTDKEHLERIQKELSEHLLCPICGSSPLQQESTPAANSSILHSSKLAELARQREELLRSSVLCEDEAAEMQERYMRTQLLKDEVDRELKADRQQLHLREQAASAGQPEELARLDSRVRVLQDTVNEALEDKESALRTIKTIIDQLSSEMGEFRQKMIETFGEFVASFLAERCSLDFRSVPRRIGQGGGPPIDFPEFHILMTSGVFRQSGTAREAPASVSESQKEFVELAFRMAFMAIASQGTSSSMILETPEASLDAVFTPKAGSTFNKFARLVEPAHVLIATSNLNGTQMIPSLLGLVDEHGEEIVDKPSVKAIDERVLNLLEVAAKSQALREYEHEYADSLAEALGRT